MTTETVEVKKTIIEHKTVKRLEAGDIFKGINCETNSYQNIYYVVSVRKNEDGTWSMETVLLDPKKEYTWNIEDWERFFKSHRLIMEVGKYGKNECFNEEV